MGIFDWFGKKKTDETKTVEKKTDEKKTVIEYHDKSKTRIKEVYTLDEHGKKQGSYEFYDYDGHLLTRCNYKDDKLDGSCEKYYQDGKLDKKCNYKDGKLDGPYAGHEYVKHELVWVECNYKEDKKDGPYEEYYHFKGCIKKRCTYKDGKKEGPYEEYYPLGKLKIKCTYKNDKKDGTYEAYHEDGQVWEDCLYKDGKLIRDFTDERCQRGFLNQRLRAASKRLRGSPMRKAVLRAQVAEFRKKYPEKDAGRKPRKAPVKDPRGGNDGM